jgi:quercetin dioxygenase-like cupin family protein
MPEHTYFEDIAAAATEIPVDSILSRTVHRDDRLKAIVFAFAPGQELSEHTASVPAIIHFLEGEADLTVGDSRYDARPGTWVRMDANVTHSIVARTPVKMLLLMLSNG